MQDRETHVNVGFGRSDLQTLIIPSGNDGGNLGPINLGRNYIYIWFMTPDISGADGLDISAEVALDPSQELVTLYEQSDPTTPWSKTLPASGSMGFWLGHAAGIQLVKLGLSSNTSAEVVWTIVGMGESVS